ncbi:MAG: hypothetical protein RLZZ546_2402 [Bacteroidota bacterium]|jgi:regulator of replication initiation timing
MNSMNENLEKLKNQIFTIIDHHNRLKIENKKIKEELEFLKGELRMSERGQISTENEFQNTETDQIINQCLLELNALKAMIENK